MYLIPVMLFTCQMFVSINIRQLLASIARKVKSSIKIGKVLQSVFFAIFRKSPSSAGIVWSLDFNKKLDWICIYYPRQNCSIYPNLP